MSQTLWTSNFPFLESEVLEPVLHWVLSLKHQVTSTEIFKLLTPSRGLVGANAEELCGQAGLKTVSSWGACWVVEEVDKGAKMCFKCCRSDYFRRRNQQPKMQNLETTLYCSLITGWFLIWIGHKIIDKGHLITKINRPALYSDSGKTWSWLNHWRFLQNMDI